ncbi:DUF305 domain-containing protein [Lentzea sp. NBRC 105346]|uniref:DUF305 domain-containing protein n=1 Tax=Lentzea sp. NBRC 105346 TaxID=3032205 RepID=UPI002557049A|nr:DUF305 domain-containing protein [Lentzea sp. NBRC 105346]
MNILRTALIGVAMLAALTACGSSEPAHNDADVKFAQEMVPHHEQALTMAKLVETRTENTGLIDLANRIEQGQQPEIDQLNARLKEWGASTHGSHGGHGMVDTSELAALKGAEFDRKWLGLMIQHHQGAVESARTEVEQGSDPATKKLAQDVITAQEKEIHEMQSLLPQG